MRLLSTLCLPAKFILLVATVTITGCQDKGTSQARNTENSLVVVVADTKRPSTSMDNFNPRLTPVVSKSTTAKVLPSQPEPVVSKSIITKSDILMSRGPVTTIFPNTPKINEIRVGLLLPLTGQNAILGKALFDAASLGLFSKKTDNFVLMPFDTQSTKEGAATAAYKATQAGVKLAIGPIFSEAVTGAAPVFQNAGIKVLALSNNRAVAERGIFLAGLFPEAQIKRLIEYAAKKGKKRLAVLAPIGQFGTRIIRATRAAATTVGTKLVRVEKYTLSEEGIAQAIRALTNYNERRSSLLDQIAILKKQGDDGSQRALGRLEILETLGKIPFDSLLVVARDSALVNVGAQLGNFDVDTKRIQLLGLGGWTSNKTGAEPPLVGSWFATIPFHADNGFSKRFIKTFGYKPHPLGTMVYDLVALAAILRPKSGSQYDGAKFVTKTGFSGASGLFRFLNDGQSQHSLEVREILRRGSKLIDPAQTHFNPPPN